MKKTKSLLSLVLAFAIVLSMFAFPVYATEAVVENGEEGRITESLLGASAPAPITDIVKEDGTPVKVACVGDSITYGYRIVSTNKETGELDNVEYTYPAMLQSKLGDGYEVGNFGKSASYLLADDNEYNVKSGKCYTDMDEYKASIDFAPDVVLIMLGTNDIKSMKTPAAIDAVEEALESLIRTYQALESVDRVYVVTSIFTYSSVVGAYTSDGPLQRVQQKAAADTGAEFVDIYSLTREYFSVMLHLGDRLHPYKNDSEVIPSALHALLTGSEYTPIEAPVAEGGVVYVSSSGSKTNDGLTPETPISSLPYAAGLLRKNGGTIVICGVYSLNNDDAVGNIMPKTNGTITITSVYGGCDYWNGWTDAEEVEHSGGAKINLNKGHLHLGGNTVFDNIKLASTSNAMIMCRFNDLTVNSNVVTVANNGVTNAVIVAGHNVLNGAPSVEDVSLYDNCNITINAGSWSYVRGGNRRDTSNATVGEVAEGACLTITINGGSFEQLNPENNVSATGMNSTHGDCNLIINGGTFGGRVFAVCRLGTNNTGNPGVCDGNVNVVINKGKFMATVRAYLDKSVDISEANITLTAPEYILDMEDKVYYFDNVTPIENNTVITTADQILEVMNDPSKWASNYVLGANVDLSEYAGELAQKPIGTYAVPFTGGFNGAGYKISGVNVTGAEAVGFFGVVESADIRNLTLDGAAVSASAATGTGSGKGAEWKLENGYYTPTGLLVGCVFAGTEITNCHSYGTVSGKGNTGGLIGMVHNLGFIEVIVNNCSNYASVTNTLGNTGGLIGRIYEKCENERAAQIKNCVNYADVYSDAIDRCRTAGICGYVTTYMAAITFDGCVNKGDITGYNTTTSTSAPYVGGVSGRVEVSGDKYAGVVYKNCSNEGTISSQYFAGGIVGYMTHSYVCTNAKTGFYNCINNGEITITSSVANKNFAGGIAGGVENDAIFEECANYGNVTTTVTVKQEAYAGGIISYATRTASSTLDKAGYTYVAGLIKNCANHGTITIDGASSQRGGGIIGRNHYYNLENCYSGGTLVSTPGANTSKIYMGAFNGLEISYGSKEFTVTNCYAKAGVFGVLTGYVESPDYCTDVDSGFVAEGEEGLKESYPTFDFYDMWTIKDGAPTLDCFTEVETGDIDADGAITNSDITIAIRYLSGWGTESYRKMRLDITNDGKINNRDAIALIVTANGTEE